MCTQPASSPRAAGGSPPRVELADILRAHGERYRQTHVLARAQRKAMRAIETCRTAALGGHKQACDTCGAVRIAYNSCRNRHCPKCQTLAKQRWLEARQAELLPVPYFHLVFTLPHILNSLAQGNPCLFYNLLFHAVADTLRSFGCDPRHLGGELGITAILHTWGQNLSQHLHLHCVVTGGALTHDGSRWISAKRDYLFPVKAMSRVFRGKYLEALRLAFDRKQITFSGPTAVLADTKTFRTYLARLWDQNWVVYAKRPFAGPEQVLEYLGRYTHRVALSNERILRFEQGRVHFRWKDSADGNRVKVLDLQAEEFIRRFLLHIVPDGFVRIRHFGLLANRTRQTKLARCRNLLHRPPPPTGGPREPVETMMLRLTGIDILLCPACHRGRLQVTETLPPRKPSPRPVTVSDTS